MISTKIFDVAFKCNKLFNKSKDYEEFLKHFITEQKNINLFDENEDEIIKEIAKILIKHLTLKEKDQQIIKKGALERAIEYIINDFTNFDDPKTLKKAVEIKKNMFSRIPEFLIDLNCLVDWNPPNLAEFEMNFEEMENFLKDNSDS